MAVVRKALIAKSTGGPEVLHLTDAPLPELADGHVRVSVSFAGVNFWDVMQRRGDVPLPADRVPGVEGVGVVAQAPTNPELLGQRVAWGRVNSSYATEVQGPADSFVVVPDGVPDEVAAGLLMQGVTAQYLSESTTDLKPGKTAVVTAAAGGVGGLLVQLLGARGADVIAVVGSEAKVAAAETTGATRVLVDSPDLAADVRAAIPAGVDAVFDAAGGDPARLLAMLRPRGICVLYGSAGGPLASLDPGLLGAGSFYLTRTAGRDYATAPGEWRGRAEDVLARAVAGELEVRVSDVLPLAEAAAGQRLLEGRTTTGKLLLDAR